MPITRDLTANLTAKRTRSIGLAVALLSVLFLFVAAFANPDISFINAATLVAILGCLFIAMRLNSSANRKAKAEAETPAEVPVESDVEEAE